MKPADDDDIYKISDEIENESDRINNGSVTSP